MTATMVEEVRLPNGFRALLVPRRSLPLVASVLWYQVGSRDERTGETGVSHFLEHMMFKGTNRYAKGEIDLLTSKMGGSNNAFTDSDGTAYYFSLASDRWETALEIESSRMRQCLLDAAEFASEKNVVLEELAMGEDDPWRPLYQATESLLFQVHPYHHPVIGWKEDLERLGVDGMRAYYDRHYGPNRAFLTVVGDFDLERTKARIEELFGDLPANAIERERGLAEPAPTGERRAVLRTPHNIARLCIGFPTCRAGERDDYALDVLAHELGLGKNCRLYKRLVLQEELVTDVSAINEARQDPGALFLLAELREGADPGRVERAVREEIEALIDEGIAKADLQRIRAQIASSFLFQDETVLDLAMKLARFEALTPEGYRTLETVLPTYESLTRAELQQVAAKYLQTDRAAIVWALPAASAEATKRSRTTTKGKGGKPARTGKAGKKGKNGKRGDDAKGGKGTKTGKGARAGRQAARRAEAVAGAGRNGKVGKKKKRK